MVSSIPVHFSTVTRSSLWSPQQPWEKRRRQAAIVDDQGFQAPCRRSTSTSTLTTSSHRIRLKILSSLSTNLSNNTNDNININDKRFQSPCQRCSRSRGLSSDPRTLSLSAQSLISFYSSPWFLCDLAHNSGPVMYIKYGSLVSMNHKSLTGDQ